MKEIERRVFISGDELYTGYYECATTVLRCSELHALERRGVCPLGSTATSYFCRWEVRISNARGSVLLKELGKKTNPRFFWT